MEASLLQTHTYTLAKMSSFSSTGSFIGTPKHNKQQLYQKPVRPGEDMWLIWEEKIRKDFPRADGITTAKLETLLYPSSSQDLQVVEEKDENTSTLPRVILLDVRTPDEFKISRLHPSAVRLGNKPSLEAAKRAVQDQIKPGEDYIVVSYGSIGYRSSKFTQLLIDSKAFPGKEVYNLKGGIFQWANEHRQIVCEDSHGNFFQVQSVHPQNPVFGEMLESNLHNYPKPKAGCVMS